MKVYKITFSDHALKDLELHRKSGNKVVLNKIDKLLNELTQHPKTGTGHPEILKHSSEEIYSRRIDQKHRLIYSIYEEIVIVYVFEVYGHYGDK